MELGEQVELNPYFKVVENKFATTGTANLVIAPNDPSRIALVFSASGTGTVWVGTNPLTNATNSIGFVIQTSQSPFMVLFSQTGAWCQQTWYAASVSAGAIINVASISTLPVER